MSNDAYITPSCNIYGFVSYDLPPRGWHWETRDGVRWTALDMPCEMIHVYPDENGNGHESPCSSVATHTVYEQRQLICKKCLDAIIAEEVLSDAETQTIAPLFQETK